MTTQENPIFLPTASDELRLEAESEARSVDLSDECERLNVAFVAQHGREPTTAEELVLWDQAYATVFR